MNHTRHNLTSITSCSFIIHANSWTLFAWNCIFWFLFMCRIWIWWPHLYLKAYEFPLARMHNENGVCVVWRAISVPRAPCTANVRHVNCASAPHTLWLHCFWIGARHHIVITIRHLQEKSRVVFFSSIFIFFLTHFPYNLRQFILRIFPYNSLTQTIFSFKCYSELLTLT